MNKFKSLFKNTKNIFMPFFMLGYPSIEASFDTIKAAIDAGCHALELGIPFSDPVADGPVIEAAGRVALKQGADFKACCELLKRIREYCELPIGLLVYYNLLFQQGNTVYEALKQVGVDAVLAVDLPLEESSAHEERLKSQGIGCVQLIAPNSDAARAKKLLERSTAFAYVVSRFGTTGVSEGLSETLAPRIQQLKSLSDCPLVVGFGISNAKQVNAVFKTGANGAIIGSQITKWLRDESPAAAHEKITTLINAI